MKTKVAFTALVVPLLVIIGLSVYLSATRGHNPRDLSYWSQAGATQDWSAAAVKGDPQAQLFHGFALIRTNLVAMVDRVPLLSAIPIIGKQCFESISYGIDSNISEEQVAEAYRWIKDSAEQGFAPAKEAEKLFIGRTGITSPGSPANGTRPAGSETN
jgi:hypothetical protein